LPPGTLIRQRSDDEVHAAAEVVDDQWWEEASHVADMLLERTPTPAPMTATRPFPPAISRRRGPVVVKQEDLPSLVPAAGVHVDGFKGAIISIGPRTDAVFDRFHLDDSILPKLRRLTATVRSSKWEVALRSCEWELNNELAANLASAMIADITNEPPIVSIKVHIFIRCPSLYDISISALSSQTNRERLKLCSFP
jgi:hypothetical protein